jgi:hypothetical protein
VDLAEQVNQEPSGAFGRRHGLAGEQTIGRADGAQVHVHGDAVARADRRFEVAQRVRLAGTTAAVQHLVVDRLEGGRHARVHERVAQAFRLAGLSPFGDEVERAVDSSQTRGHARQGSAVWLSARRSRRLSSR